MSGWNDEKIEILRSEWGQGTSASEIAKMIGGVTRNAVIGKAHRMQLGQKGKSQPATSKKEGVPVSKTAKSIVKLQARAAVAAAAPVTQVLKFELPPTDHFGTDAVFRLDERTCKWPINDPMKSDFRFCGAARGTDQRAPYCTHHIGIAYADPNKRSVRVAERRRA